jgi:hypothetical protein
MSMIKITVPASALFLVLCLGCARQQQETTGFKVDTLTSPTNAGSAEPYLFTDSKGKVYMSWVEKTDIGHQLLFSTIENQNWTTPTMIASDSNWFVNWADYPMIAADGSGSMLAHVLSRHGTSTYAYDVRMTTSSDHGSQWREPFLLNEDGKEGEHGFVSMVPFGDSYLVAWLDGRNTVMEGMEQHEGHHGAMSLRAAVLTHDGKKLEEWQLDDRTCDCCQTTAVITRNGPAVVYRDRSDAEVRDMAIVRYVGGVWTTSTIIHEDNWKIEGCPVNGPRADGHGNTIAIAWFTAANDQPAVKLIFSDDGGLTFTEPFKVDGGKSIGRVDVVMVNEETAWVSWMEGADIRLRAVDRNGSMTPSVTIGTSSSSRSSGFPQLTSFGGGVVVAWTDDLRKSVRTAVVTVK